MIEPGGLTSEGAGQPSLSGAGLPGDDEVFMRLQPGALGQLSLGTYLGSPSLCVVHLLLVALSLWTGMRTKTKWSPGPGGDIATAVLRPSRFDSEYRPLDVCSD
ncbi:hypothetical protein [Mesorhizobium sp. M0701]|uniref:hypothetical protein n=1 Tax=Mesorhizobium sp. M0701 TaxID=2956989 RepID=UPI00333BABFD